MAKINLDSSLPTSKLLRDQDASPPPYSQVLHTGTMSNRTSSRPRAHRGGDGEPDIEMALLSAQDSETGVSSRNSKVNKS